MTNFTFMWLSVLSIMVGWVVGYYAPEYLLLVIPIYVGCVIKFFGEVETLTEEEAAQKLADPMEDAFDVITGGKRE